MKPEYSTALTPHERMLFVDAVVLMGELLKGRPVNQMAVETWIKLTMKLLYPELREDQAA